MDTSNSAFNWLRAELCLIKSQTFHEFIPLCEDDYLYTHGEVVVSVKGDYSDFLREFGWTNMFKGWGDLIDIPLIVYPLKEYRREHLKDGGVFVAFGDRGAQHVFFDESKILSGEPSAVFIISKSSAKEIYASFSEWLKASYEWARAKYSRRQWALVIKGAAPFSDAEQEVATARSSFKWKNIGFSDSGDAIFEIHNCSNMTLPFLSIGVKDIDDAILKGGVFLRIGHIAPGKSGTTTADCYKDRIPREKVVFFPKPDPVPELRDRYWEFGIPK
jgi:hypothetical protein